MNVRKILSIEHQGLKAHDARHDLSGCDVIIGGNGTGKSSVIDAHRLLAFGSVPGVDANNQGVMTLARPGAKRLVITERVEMDDGRVCLVERAWLRDRSGSVTQRVEIDGEKMTAKDGALRLREMFAGLSEAWDPGALFSLSPVKMRDRLLRIIPRTATETALPSDMPTWAKPKAGDLPPIEAVAFAIKAADDKVREYQADASTQEKTITQLLVGPEVKAETDIPTAPIEARAAKLRAELVARGDRDRAETVVENTRADLARAQSAAAKPLRVSELLVLQGKLAAALGTDGVEAVRARVADNLHRLPVSPAGDDVRRAKAEIDECIREIVARAQSSAAEIVRAQGRVTHARAKITGDIASVKPATAADVERAKTALDTVLPEGRAAEKAIATLEAQLAALTSPEIECCPECSYSFVKVFEAQRAVVATALEDARFDLSVVQPAIDEAREAHRVAVLGVRRAEADREVAQAEAELARAKAQAPRLPEDVLPREWVNGIQATASEIVAEAEAQATGARDVPRLAEALAEAEAVLARLPSADRACGALEAEIRAVEAEMKYAAVHNANASIIREANATIEALAERVDEVKGWRERFVEIQEALIGHAKTWLEERYTSLLGGMPVEVRLRDALGNPDCVVLVDGVPVTTLCPGHRAIALVAFVILLAGVSEGGFRLLPIDELEKVSRENRAAFLGAIRSAIDEGTISQALISGCPDSVPEIPGVTVHDLSSPVVEEAAA